MCSVLAISLIAAAAICMLAVGGFIIANILYWLRLEHAFRELGRDFDPRHFNEEEKCGDK